MSFDELIRSFRDFLESENRADNGNVEINENVPGVREICDRIDDIEVGYKFKVTGLLGNGSNKETTTEVVYDSYPEYFDTIVVSVGDNKHPVGMPIARHRYFMTDKDSGGNKVGGFRSNLPQTMLSLSEDGNESSSLNKIMRVYQND
ncbi:hypothetical protein CMI42_06470 [Candidatus Pacearchaeota archaeon]|nr:hypothetical protein [Candidatus Pacearchaeota archaeon]|tara:strand:- start:19 stop:459 length:441 start_codon:yes stop_codon:yes gene_type:complete